MCASAPLLLAPSLKNEGKDAGGEGSKFSAVWYVGLGKGRVVGGSVGGGFGNEVRDGMRSEMG